MYNNSFIVFIYGYLVEFHKSIDRQSWGRWGDFLLYYDLRCKPSHIIHHIEQEVKGRSGFKPTRSVTLNKALVLCNGMVLPSSVLEEIISILQQIEHLLSDTTISKSEVWMPKQDPFYEYFLRTLVNSTIRVYKHLEVEYLFYFLSLYNKSPCYGHPFRKGFHLDLEYMATAQGIG